MEELDNELDAQGRELSIAEARLAEMSATIVGLRWREATWMAQKRRMLGGDGGGGGNVAAIEDGMVADGESIRRDGVERDEEANSAGSVAVTVEDIAAGELSVQNAVTGEVVVVPLPQGIAAGDQMDVPSALLTGSGGGTSGGSSAQQQQQQQQQQQHSAPLLLRFPIRPQRWQKCWTPLPRQRTPRSLASPRPSQPVRLSARVRASPSTPLRRTGAPCA